MNLDGTKVARLLGLALAALIPLVTLVLVFPARQNAGEAIDARPAAPGASTDIAAPQRRRPLLQQIGSEPEVAPLSASEFAEVFVEATTRYARARSDPARLSHSDCVRAAPGRYMCSYAVNRPGAPRACHLMQARLTPRAASSFVVTLAGRTRRCG